MEKKYLIILFLQFYGTRSAELWQHEAYFAHELTSAQTYDHSIELCMEIWTELDLLGAIRTSTEDLMYFADKMVDKLLALEILLVGVKRCHRHAPYSYEDMENLNDLAHRIDERFYDIFSSINSKEVACCLVLIERFLDALEKISFSQKITSSMIHQDQHSLL